MIAAQISAVEGDTIANLCDGMEVLQVGCRQGFETAALAQSAARIITMAQDQGIPHVGFRDAAHMWRVIQGFYHTAETTMLIQEPVNLVARMFTPGQFDVAVLDMGLFTDDVTYALVMMLIAVASKVVVIPRPGQSFLTGSDMIIMSGLVIEQAGGIWVIDLPPAQVPTEPKGED